MLIFVRIIPIIQNLFLSSHNKYCTGKYWNSPIYNFVILLGIITFFKYHFMQQLELLKLIIPSLIIVVHTVLSHFLVE